MRPKPKGFSEREREFWGALNDYIRENEGFSVSEPHAPFIRFECRPESDLPDLLRAKGYSVNSAGTNERLMPVTELVREHGSIRKVVRQHVAPTTVAAFEFGLPDAGMTKSEAGLGCSACGKPLAKRNFWWTNAVRQWNDCQSIRRSSRKPRG
jgi:hypothetical protein